MPYPDRNLRDHATEIDEVLAGGAPREFMPTSAEGRTNRTPGPWTISEEGRLFGADGVPVGEPLSGPRDMIADATRVEADRVVMAAAPKMMAALLQAEEALEHSVPKNPFRAEPRARHLDALTAVRAAIAAAEG